MKEIAGALSKAQAEFKPAPFDVVNPFFKSKYASLTSIVATIRPHLAANGLSYTQSIIKNEHGFWLATTLWHVSGESIMGFTPMLITKNDMQGVGAALTYGKRLGLAALLGIVTDEDDDGNATQRHAGGFHATNPGGDEPSGFYQEDSFGHFNPPAPVLSNYIIPFGKFKNKRLLDVSKGEIRHYLEWLGEQKAKENPKKEPTPQYLDFIMMTNQYLEADE